MKKIIPAKIIENCTQCSYIRYDGHYDEIIICNLRNRELPFQSNYKNGFPKGFCPLEDYKEE